LDLATIGTFPEIPESGKGEGLPVLKGDVHRSFALALGLPFIKTIRDNQAAFPAQQTSKARFLCQCLGPGVNHARADRFIFGPCRDESPAQQAQMWTSIIKNGDDILRWRNIVAR